MANLYNREPGIDLDKVPGLYESPEESMIKYAAMRAEVMTELQVEECDHFLDYYRESWYDKDVRGLFVEYQLADKYWEGDVNLPEFSDDPGSNTNFINANVEGRVALFMDAPMEPDVYPVDIGDVQYQEDAQHICNFIVEKNNLQHKIENIYRRFVKYGTSVVSVLWDYDALDGKGFPVVRSWNPAYVFFDPVIVDIEDFQKSRFIILQTVASKIWAKNTFGEEKARAIKPNVHPVESQFLFDEDLGLSNDSQQMAYLHLFVFTKDENGTVRLVQMSGDGVLLWDSLDYPSCDFLGEYPIFVGINQQREGTLHGKSAIKDLIPMQDVVNELDDQLRYNARLTGNVQKVIGTTSGIDPLRWTNQPGLNIPATNVDAWKVVVPPSMPPYIQNMRNTVMNERQIVSRFADSMTGVKQQGVDTATESLGLAQTGMSVIDKDKKVIQMMMSHVVAYAFRLAEHKWDTYMAFRITGSERFAYIKPKKLTKIPALVPATDEFIRKAREKAKELNGGELPPDFKMPTTMQQEIKGQPVFREATFDIKINMGAGIPTSKAFRYTALKEAAQFPVAKITSKEYRKALRELGILPVADETEDEIVARMDMLEEASAKQANMSAQSNMINSMANAQKAGIQPDQAVQGLNATGSVNRPASKQGGVVKGAVEG